MRRGKQPISPVFPSSRETKPPACFHTMWGNLCCLDDGKQYISGVVARLLSFCPSARIAASSARAATRARRHASGATLPAAYAGDGRRQNESTMDGARGALVPLAACFRLRGSQARWGAVSCRGQMGEGTRRSTRMEPYFRVRCPSGLPTDEKTCPKGIYRGCSNYPLCPMAAPPAKSAHSWPNLPLPFSPHPRGFDG